MAETYPIEVSVIFEAKSYDIDYAGIVNNQVYIRWLEDLRLALMAEHFSLEAQLAQNVSPVLEKTEITYRRPVRLLERPVGRMWVSKLGKARWELEAKFVLGDLVVATAKHSGYFIDLERFRPVRIPAELRALWESAGQGG